MNSIPMAFRFLFIACARGYFLSLLKWPVQSASNNPSSFSRRSYRTDFRLLGLRVLSLMCRSTSLRRGYPLDFRKYGHNQGIEERMLQLLFCERTGFLVTTMFLADDT